jgi:CBS domain-containing protein
MLVREVMTRGVECTRPDATLQEAAAKMKSLDVGVLPVCGKDDRLAGMITDRDITVRAAAEGESPKVIKVADVMTPDVFYCFEDDDVVEASRLMQEKQVRRVVVLDRGKRLTGIVSLGDLATEPGSKGAAAEALEEVSGPA